MVLSNRVPAVTARDIARCSGTQVAQQLSYFVPEERQHVFIHILAPDEIVGIQARILFPAEWDQFVLVSALRLGDEAQSGGACHEVSARERANGLDIP